MKHHVIITCLTAEYHKQLPSCLLNKGYTVSPGYGDDTCTMTKGIVSIISYCLLTKENKTNNDISEDIKFCFEQIKGYYYTVYVSNFNIDSPVLKFGNIDGETDITRVLQIKALW